MGDKLEDYDVGSGHKELADVEAGSDVIDPVAEQKLVRKIDLLILPCMWIMYLLSYMDRTK